MLTHSSAVSCSECGRVFKSAQGFQVHRTRNNLACGDAVPLPAPQHGPSSSDVALMESARAEEAGFGSALRNEADSADTQNLLLTSRTQRRFFNNVSVRALQLERESTMQLMCAVKEQLQKELHSGMSKEAMDRTITEVCNVFNGIDTDAKEDTAIAAMLQSCGMEPQQPVRRNLRHPTTGQLTGSVCYDIPIDVSLAVLLQSRRPLWEMIYSHASRWATRGAQRHGKEVEVLRDIPDGTVYRMHPKLGDAAAAEAIASTPEAELRSVLKLSLVVYYDEVEVTNPLGASAGVHKLGLFYYAIVDLPPEHRMNLNNIQLATVVKYKDLRWVGGAEVISGSTGEAYGVGSCIGACMERLNTGIELKVPWAKNEFKLHAWVALWAADYPAAAMVGGFKASTSAHVFCRQCTVHQKEMLWKQPFSFLARTMSTSSWTLRSMPSYKADEKTYSEAATSGARDELLQRAGISVFPAPCSRIPFLDWTTCLPQDIMHVLLEGVVKLELAAMVFMLVRVLRWCTLDELNQTCERYQGWVAHHSPLHFHAVLTEGRRAGEDDVDGVEGEEEEEDGDDGRGRRSAGSGRRRVRRARHRQTLIRPKKGCHVVGSAAQVLEFTVHSLHALAPIIQQPAHHVWQSWKTLVMLLRLLMEREFSRAQVCLVDEIVQLHQTNFKKVPEYEDLFLPKHHFCTHIPVDILNFGPPRRFWCMRFEAMNQVFKRIASGGNFREILKRCAHHACVRTALISVWNAYSWGMTEELAGGEVETVARGATAHLHALKRSAADMWLQRSAAHSVEVAWLHSVRHAGMLLEVNATWLLWHPLGEQVFQVQLGKITVLARVSGLFFVGLSCPHTSFVGEDPASGLKLLQIAHDQPQRFYLYPLDELSVLPQYLIRYNASTMSDTPVYMLIAQAGEQPPR